MRRFLFSTLCIGLLSGCLSTLPTTSTPPPPAPLSAPQPFILPIEPNLAFFPEVEGIQTDHEYDLAELIHLAQTHNPATRIAWQEAEQAALAAGMVKSTYLPMITASVIAGRQSFHTDHNIELAQLVNIKTRSKDTGHGVVPALTLSWLLFDFGRRDAAHQAALELSTAQQAKFNTAHQLTVFNVARHYFEYNAARQKTQLAHDHYQQSLRLIDAAQARLEAGVGTQIDLAQAKQLTAQARLVWVQHQGVERDSYQGLVGAMGLVPTTRLQIKNTADRPLPPMQAIPSEVELQNALMQRSDLIAADAVVRAAEQDINFVKADYLPTLGLMAVAATGTGSFNANNAVVTSPHIKGNAVFLGMSVPIYDGGLRRQRLHAAESKVQAARDILQQTKQLAFREIHFAANALRTALEAHEASQELLAAAQLTSLAAQEAYEVGLSSMMLATESANALLDATQAAATAHAAALTASANLAFVMGQIDAAQVLAE